VRTSRWILGGALALTLLSPAAAQSGSDIITAADVDAILAIAAGRGWAARDDQENGNPGIAGTINGVDYYIYFVNCVDGGTCEDLNFYAGFIEVTPALDTINEWNRDRRFGRAYLDQEGDAVIELDLNLEYGVSRDNLDANFLLWGLIIDEFTTFVGYEK